MPNGGCSEWAGPDKLKCHNDVIKPRDSVPPRFRIWPRGAVFSRPPFFFRKPFFNTFFAGHFCCVDKVLAMSVRVFICCHLLLDLLIDLCCLLCGYCSGLAGANATWGSTGVRGTSFYPDCIRGMSIHIPPLTHRYYLRKILLQEYWLRFFSIDTVWKTCRWFTCHDD